MAVYEPGWVTINTDAGFYHWNGLASFAYWIRFNGQLITGSGVMKERQKGSSYAEERSVLNALHVVNKQISKGIVKIIFNCDCLPVCADPKMFHGKLIYAVLQEMHQKYIVSAGLSVPFEKFFEFRHVKAHTDADNKRSWVNKRLDEMCKLALVEESHRLIAEDRKRRQQEGYKLKKKRRWN